MVEEFVQKAKGRFKYALQWVLENVILTGSIVPNQMLFYALIVLNGLYNALFVSAPTQILEKSFTPLQYTIFVGMVIAAPLSTMIGKTLRGKWAETGMVMQFFGDIGVCGVCTTFVVATIYTSWWGQGNFGGVFVLASALGSTLFVIRDSLALMDRDRWVKVE